MQRFFLLLMVCFATTAWSATAIVDFEGTVETSDVGSNGLPTRVTTQGYEFLSACGLSLNDTGGNAQLYICPAGSATMYTKTGDFFDLDSIEAGLAPISSGSGTLTLEGCNLEFECTSITLPVGQTWATFNIKDDYSSFSLPDGGFATIQFDSAGGPIVVGIDNLVLTADYTFVDIDVLPGDEANKIFPNRLGNFPVAALSGPTFDATQIDPGTVTLRSNSVQASPGDVPVISNVDGLYGPDITFRFRTQDTGINCFSQGVSLTGDTYAGEPVSGYDTIDASDCSPGGCHVY